MEITIFKKNEITFDLFKTQELFNNIVFTEISSLKK